MPRAVAAPRTVIHRRAAIARATAVSFIETVATGRLIDVVEVQRELVEGRFGEFDAGRPGAVAQQEPPIRARVLRWLSHGMSSLSASRLDTRHMGERRDEAAPFFALRSENGPAGVGDAVIAPPPLPRRARPIGRESTPAPRGDITWHRARRG